MCFGDDEEDSSSSSGSSDSDSSSGSDSSGGSDDSGGSSDVVDLSDKQGVVDPADLKKDDPPEGSLPIVDPPSPDTTPPGLRGDDPRVDISGRTPNSTDLPTPDDQSRGSDSGSDSGGGDGGDSGSGNGN